MDEKAKIYVGNLPYNYNDDQLAAAFAPFGEVVEAKVITDRVTGRSRGFGFVTMTDEATAEKAIKEINGKEIDGRPLVANIARPMRPRPER